MQYNGYNSNQQNQKESFKAADKLDPLSYVKQAETIILKLSKNTDKYGNVKAVSTNQIRNILTMTNELFAMIQYSKNDKLDSTVISHSQYIKMKIAYLAGRDRSTKDFVIMSRIMDYLDAINGEKKSLLLVCKYMEALCAYHKYHINN